MMPARMLCCKLRSVRIGTDFTRLSCRRGYSNRATRRSEPSGTAPRRVGARIAPEFAPICALQSVTGSVPNWIYEPKMNECSCRQLIFFLYKYGLMGFVSFYTVCDAEHCQRYFRKARICPVQPGLLSISGRLSSMLLFLRSQSFTNEWRYPAHADGVSSHVLVCVLHR